MDVSLIISISMIISKRTMKINTLFQSLILVNSSIYPVFGASMSVGTSEPYLYWNCTDTVDSTDDESLWTALQEVKQDFIEIFRDF